MRIGGRTVLAATCLRCGTLTQGSAFRYHLRNAKDKRAYIDRRCGACQWARMPR